MQKETCYSGQAKMHGLQKARGLKSYEIEDGGQGPRNGYMMLMLINFNNDSIGPHILAVLTWLLNTTVLNDKSRKSNLKHKRFIPSQLS